MLTPTSLSVVFLRLIACAGLLIAVARARHWALKAAAGAGVVAVAVATGVVGVNDYFGDLASWSGVYAGTFGGANPSTDTVDTRQVGAAPMRTGRLLSIDLPGHNSHIDRHGLVYLPPQYGSRQYRTVRFPGGRADVRHTRQSA